MIAWITAFLVAVTIVELCLRFLQSDWLKHTVAALLANLRQLQLAQGDNDRQRWMIQTGLATLRFSVWVILLLMLLAGLAFVFPWALSWDAGKQSEYWSATAVVGLGWWLVRVWRKAR